MRLVHGCPSSVYAAVTRHYEADLIAREASSAHPRGEPYLCQHILGLRTGQKVNAPTNVLPEATRIWRRSRKAEKAWQRSRRGVRWSPPTTPLR